MLFVLNRERERKKEKKKTVPFEENLLGSLRPFPGPTEIEFFYDINEKVINII